MKISRREFLSLGALTVLGLSHNLSAHTQSNLFIVEPNSDGKFYLPTLDYAYDALEQAIDKETMLIHHTKHHQSYIDKLNAGLEKLPSFKHKSLDFILANTHNIPKESLALIKNNGGGHYNHTFFWKTLTPQKEAIGKKTTQAIIKNFQSIEQFQKRFKEAGLACFGSGWVWLLQKKDKSLVIRTFPNQDNFLMNPEFAKEIPLLGLDVWEHAYYLRYQNKRADYIDKYFNLIRWSFVEKQLQ